MIASKVVKGLQARITAYMQRHYGVIARAEVYRLGGDARYIQGRVRAGEWGRRHPNVFIATSAPRTPNQDLAAAMAAVSASVASHQSAAWLLGLFDTPPACPDVATTDRRGYRLTGVTVHRASEPIPSLRQQGFPCTTAVRTLVDIAATCGTDALTAALDRALQRRLAAVPRLERALATTEKARPGAAILRAVLGDRGMIGTPEPSVLESHMDRLLDRSGLPRAQAQYRVEGGRYRFDYAWPEIRLAIEAKGYAWHSSPEALAADSQRERHMAGQEWTFLSYTWVEVLRRPDEVIAEIAAVYARLSARPAS